MFRRRDPEPSIAAVMAQWLEYELIFNDILTRLGAQLARQAKIEKRRIAREPDPPTVGLQPPAPTTKAALRAQYAQARFGGRIQAIIDSKNGAQNEPQNAIIPSSPNRPAEVRDPGNE